MLLALFELIRRVFEFLIAGGGPCGTAPEQAALLHDVWAAEGAEAALLPPRLLGGGGGGDQPGPGGQLADATGQLGGAVHTRTCSD